MTFLGDLNYTIYIECKKLLFIAIFFVLITMRHKYVVELTHSAAKKIQELAQSRQKEYLKIGVKKRGCSGQSYMMHFVDKKNKFDEEIIIDKTKLLIESSAIMFLIGSKLNYIQDDLKSEFKFENPNSKGACGCGESFKF